VSVCAAKGFGFPGVTRPPSNWVAPAGSYRSGGGGNFSSIFSSDTILSSPEGLSLDDQDAELLFRKAVVHRQRGESAEAETYWRRILELRRPDRFASLDMGIYGHLTRRNLAVLAQERGDSVEAAQLWRAVLAECPGDREARAMVEQFSRLVNEQVPTRV
jgi:hypothetical protein